MTANRLQTRFNTRNDVFDSIVPNWRVQDKISAPHGEWKPAAWLPIAFTSSNVGAGTDAYVISSGKVVAQDAEGFIVPAGLQGAWAKTGATTVLTYTQTDVDWGVRDLTTGARLSAAVSYTALEVAKALVERGLVDPADTTSGNNPPSSDTDVAEIAALFISNPVGVIAYDVHVWSGRPEDGDQFFTNYSKQALVQFLTEVQASVPHMTVDSTGSTGALDVSVLVPASSVTAGSFPAASTLVNATGLNTWARYDQDLDGTESLLAVILAHRDVAAHTARTPFTCDVAGVLVSRKESIADIAAEGDWFLDRKAGVLIISSLAYDTLVANNTDPTFTYYYYSSSAAAASDRYIHFTGEGRPGDDVSFDEYSNFCVMASADDVLGTSNTRSLGRLHVLDTEPKDLLQHVKTAFELDNMSASGKMPGTATAGFSDKITLSGENVSDQLAVINVRI